MVESYLQDCWKWAAAKSEILPGAALTVEQIPAITLCEDCGHGARWGTAGRRSIKVYV